MDLFAILLDGDLQPTARLQRQLSERRIIAADGGIRHATALGLVPEIWLGDFDSAPEALPANLQNVPKQAYSTDKNETDGEIAVNTALEMGAKNLLLVGAFGGKRADHALLHKLLAFRLANGGAQIVLSDGLQEGQPLLPGTHDFDLPGGTLFSLIGFSDLSGLTITGAKWPLDNVELPLGSSLTLSNRVDGDLRIVLKQGKALMVAQLTA